MISSKPNYFANKGPSSQSYSFSSGHVWMWELDYKERWVPKSWCFWTVVLEKTWESLGLRGDPTSPSIGDQSWVFIGSTDVEAESLTTDGTNWLTAKDPDAGKDWRWEEKGTTEDEMIGWHHRLNGHEFVQGRLACYSPWGRKELDTNEQLNNNLKT